MYTTTPGEDAFWEAYGLFAKERPPYTYHYHLAPDKPVFSHSHAAVVKGHTHEGRGITMRVIPPEPASDAQSHPTLPYHRLGGNAGLCVGIPCTYHLQSGWPCVIDACEEIWCGQDGFRNFCYPHAARINAYHRNIRQGCGREVGHQIAIDALVALASAPYPVSLIDGVGTAEETREAKEDFDRAARRELLKTVQESITDSSAFVEQEGVQELTADEGRALFRKQCWRWLGLSAEEFVRKWVAGDFNDRMHRPEVMRVAMLLPLWDFSQKD